MKRLTFTLRVLSRMVVIGIVGAFVTVVGLQYSRIIGKNVTMAGALAAAQNDVSALQAKRAEQDRQIRRLSDPAGAIPEIHDKLHLVRDGEAIIYLKKHDAGP
jgi:cell division protein FtsB